MPTIDLPPTPRPSPLPFADSSLDSVDREFSDSDEHDIDPAPDSSTPDLDLDMTSLAASDRTMFKLPIFTGSGFQQWKPRVLMHCEYDGTLEVLEGKEDKPGEELEVLLKEWKKKDTKARHTLLQALSERGACGCPVLLRDRR